MSTLLQRLQNALSPKFLVERELARGGMGAVFLAHDVSLDRHVAIKVLLPELATAAATDSFLREARILASLSHSHIVPVHTVGEAGGLSYYVMDYVDGETVAERIRRRPMTRAEVVKLGRDLLDALEVTHRAGVIHRDVKPSNVFLIGDRALLADFGIAKPAPDATDSETRSGVIGTPAYMPPEQQMGNATPSSDLYATAMVLYEALTCRLWEAGADPASADWTGVPRDLGRVLARALAPLQQARWPDAKTFRYSWWTTRVHRYRWRAVGLTTAGLLLGGAVGWWFTHSVRAIPAGSLTVRVERFESTGEGVPVWIGDSVALRVEQALHSSEFRVLPRGALQDREPAVILSGEVISSESGVTVRVRSKDLAVNTEFTADSWEMAANAAATRVLRDLWSDGSPLRRWLPVDALPVDRDAFNLWLEAEALLDEGRWDEAREAYHTIVAIDDGCVLCSWRITEIQRWQLEPPDSMHRRLLLERDSVFPVHYRRLIKARLGLLHRLDALREAADSWRDYYYAWFLLGEEQLNRGPLYGLRRAEAASSLERAALLRPEFVVIWWDLAWLRIAEGDASGALEALNNIALPRDRFSMARVGLLQLAFAYRFGDTDAADDMTRAALANEEIWNYPATIAGPRFLPSFDAPNGAVRMGAVYLTMPRRDFHRSGLIAQTLGYFAQGQLDSARSRGAILLRDYPEAVGMTLFMAKLEAVNRMFDLDGSHVDMERIKNQLSGYAADGVGSVSDRRGARWLLQLLVLRGVVVVDTEWPQSGSTPAEPALEGVVRAVERADRGLVRDAIVIGQSLLDREIAGNVPDAFFRTVLHLLMAEWYAATGDRRNAIEELRWHEAMDEAEFPTDEPLVQEVDWAFGTLARWKRTQLLEDADDHGGETCSSYRAVVRLWSPGDDPYAARAELARRRLGAIGCDE